MVGGSVGASVGAGVGFGVTFGFGCSKNMLPPSAALEAAPRLLFPGIGGASVPVGSCGTKFPVPGVAVGTGDKVGSWLPEVLPSEQNPQYLLQFSSAHPLYFSLEHVSFWYWLQFGILSLQSGAGVGSPTQKPQNRLQFSFAQLAYCPWQESWPYILQSSSLSTHNAGGNVVFIESFISNCSGVHSRQ